LPTYRVSPIFINFCLATLSVGKKSRIFAPFPIFFQILEQILQNFNTSGSKEEYLALQLKLDLKIELNGSV
jgi:hypothetical protein